MAIATYNDLLTQIGTYLARDDYTAQAPVWVTLASAKINRLVKARETKTTSFSINAEYVNLPPDFIEARSFRITSTDLDQVLTFKTEDQMTQDHTSTGQPAYFCVVGSQFRFAPSPDATYTATLMYFATPDVLSGAQTTNSLFPTHADLYLYGALLEALGQGYDDPRADRWESKFNAAVADINKLSNRARWGAPMVQRPG